MRTINQKERERIGAKIKELRAEKEISQRDLAELSGLSNSNIANIELGRYSVGLDVLSSIATSLDCTVELIKKKDGKA